MHEYAAALHARLEVLRLEPKVERCSRMLVVLPLWEIISLASRGCTVSKDPSARWEMCESEALWEDGGVYLDAFACWLSSCLCRFHLGVSCCTSILQCRNYYTGKIYVVETRRERELGCCPALFLLVSPFHVLSFWWEDRSRLVTFLILLLSDQKKASRLKSLGAEVRGVRTVR